MQPPTDRPVKVLPKTSSSGGTIFFGVMVLVMESFEASRPGNFDSVSSSACKVLRLRHDVLANDLQSNECDRVRDVSGACEWRRSRGISIVSCKASVSTKKKERQEQQRASSCIRQEYSGLDALCQCRIGPHKISRDIGVGLGASKVHVTGLSRPMHFNHKRAISRCCITNLSSHCLQSDRAALPMNDV